MKKIFLLLTFTVLLAKSQAQTVTITDANFLSWLQFTYPTCITGNQMDITCAAIISDTLVEIPNLNIGNIEGIKYFTSLRVLDCSNNNLTAIPEVPVSLKRLICSNNNISSIQNLPFELVELNVDGNQLAVIPDLPNTLDILKCYDNQLSALPTFVNTQLRVLHCGGNLFTSLPPLPQALQELDCRGLGLQTLPTSLPFQLKILVSPYNELTSLPTLPNSITKLNVYGNQINSLTELPNSLQDLNVGSNNLQTLPAFPGTVTSINCELNAINILPNFPNALKHFYGRYNLLSAIPQIPNSVRVFDCSYNPVICLDFAAYWNHIEPAYFYFDNTEVSCRPTYSLNLEPTSLAHYMSFPMCQSNNVSGCGILSVDENANAINLKVYPNPSNDFIQLEATQPLENIKMYDMAGRKVLEQITYNTNTTLNISGLSHGVYTLMVGRQSIKIIKQ